MTMPFGNAIAAGHLRRHAVGRDQRNDTHRRLRRVLHPLAHLGEVEADAVDVDVAAPVDGRLAPDVWTDVGQVDMADTRSVRLKAHEFEAGLEHPTIGQPADRLAHARYAVCDNLDVAVKVGGNDLVGPPVREPQAVTVPPWRLDHGQPVQQHTGLKLFPDHVEPVPRCGGSIRRGRHRAQRPTARNHRRPGVGRPAAPTSRRSPAEATCSSSVTTRAVSVPKPSTQMAVENNKNQV